MFLFIIDVYDLYLGFYNLKSLWTLFIFGRGVVTKLNSRAQITVELHFFSTGTWSAENKISWGLLLLRFGCS
jgi:hypothetical protein